MGTHQPRFFSSLNILIFDTHRIRVELMISVPKTETVKNFKQKDSNTWRANKNDTIPLSGTNIILGLILILWVSHVCNI